MVGKRRILKEYLGGVMSKMNKNKQNTNQKNVKTKEKNTHKKKRKTCFPRTIIIVIKAILPTLDGIFYLPEFCSE
jgi:hypothetical protein